MWTIAQQDMKQDHLVQLSVLADSTSELKLSSIKKKDELVKLKQHVNQLDFLLKKHNLSDSQDPSKTNLIEHYARSLHSRDDKITSLKSQIHTLNEKNPTHPSTANTYPTRLLNSTKSQRKPSLHDSFKPQIVKKTREDLDVYIQELNESFNETMESIKMNHQAKVACCLQENDYLQKEFENRFHETSQSEYPSPFKYSVDSLLHNVERIFPFKIPSGSKSIEIQCNLDALPQLRVFKKI